MVRLRTHSIARAGTTDVERRFALSVEFVYPKGVCTNHTSVHPSPLPVLPP